MFVIVFSIAFGAALVSPSSNLIAPNEMKVEAASFDEGFAVGLKASIKSNNSTDKIESTFEKGAKSLVDLGREIAYAAAVIFLLSMGYSLWIKKSAEGLADMKARTGLLIVSIFCIFFAEQILGAIFSMLGYSVS